MRPGIRGRTLAAMSDDDPFAGLRAEAPAALAPFDAPAHVATATIT